MLAVMGCTALFAQTMQSNQTETYSGAKLTHENKANQVFHQESNGQNGYGVANLTMLGGAILIADDFELTENTTITKVTGYGFQSSATTQLLTTTATHLDVIIYEGDNTKPSQLPDKGVYNVKIPVGPNAKITVSGNIYTLELNLEAAGIKMELTGGKHYWISIHPTTKDTTGNNRWAWFKATTQAFPGKASLIDTADLFNEGLTDWTPLDDFLTAPWGNFGMAFTLEGNKTLGNNEVVLDKSISIYPNPASNKLNIELVGGQTIKTVSIQDFTGKTLIATKSSTEVDVQALPKGTYLVTIETNQGKKITKKFIKK